MDGLANDLLNQAYELGRSCTPANDFLTSEEFRAVVPEGIEIPEAEPFSGSGARGGAMRVVVSLVTTVMAILIGLV